MYIPRILGTDILFSLIEHGENITTIVVPPSLYDLTSERVKMYMKKARISLEKGDSTPGRPPKYTDDDIQEIINLKENGMSVSKISKKLNIPRRTIYYLLEKTLE